MMIDGYTRKNLEKVLRTIKKREKTFGKALLSLAFSRDDKKDLKVCFGRLDFLRKGEFYPKDTKYDYGDFILTKKSVEVQDVIKIIHVIFEEQLLKTDDWPEVPLKVHLNDLMFIPSHSNWGYVTNEWPMVYASARISDNSIGKTPSDSLSKLGLPLYPSGVEAITTFFELSAPEEWSTLDNRIMLLVPDYRARIKSLRLAGNKVTVDVETKEIALGQLIAKFYCKGKSKRYTSEDLHLEDGCVSYTTEEEPFQVEVDILSALDGELIDKRKFDYRYPSREEGIIIENVEAPLLDIIKKGENINVEFKKELSNEEFLETVVAFANTGGGTIFLGVDDNCRIKGFSKDVKDKIVNLISDRCDPPVDVQIDSISLQKKPITLVTVPEGKNKPYTLRDRGLFIRRGSSDRQIKRTELDEIYAKKQSPHLR